MGAVTIAFPSPVKDGPLALLPPGYVIGLLGGGQLGWMSTESAQRQGYRVIVYTPNPDDPACMTADATVLAPYADAEMLQDWYQRVDVVTLEFENIPQQALSNLTTLPHAAPLCPQPAILAVTQHRFHEKTLLASLGLPVAPFAHVTTHTALVVACQTLGLPAVLKTCTQGYDGKGQHWIHTPADIPTIAQWDVLCQANAEWLLEARVPFVAECSMLIARNARGETQTSPLIENRHANGILDVSCWPFVTASPAIKPDRLAQQASAMLTTLAETLHLVGVLCMECFVTADGQLWVNELAPRPHNSLHLSREAFTVSQFDWHIQAITGQPLSPMQPAVSAAAMVNILGECWGSQGELPNWAAAEALSTDTCTISVTDYEKSQAKPGRKMAHLVVTGSDVDTVVTRAVTARQAAAHLASVFAQQPPVVPV